MDETRYARFLEQEVVFKDISHPNIAKYHGTAIIEKLGYSRLLVLESIPHTLRTRIPMLNVASAESVLHGIALAASVIHAKQLVHFDFRPENILVSDDLSPKLVDFSLCSTTLIYKDHCNSKRIGYIAPELTEGESCTRDVDIFAFGMLITTVFANLQMPNNIASLVEQCLSRDPANRSQWPAILYILSNTAIVSKDKDKDVVNSSHEYLQRRLQGDYKLERRRSGIFVINNK